LRKKKGKKKARGKAPTSINGGKEGGFLCRRKKKGGLQLYLNENSGKKEGEGARGVPSSFLGGKGGGMIYPSGEKRKEGGEGKKPGGKAAANIQSFGRGRKGT